MLRRPSALCATPREEGCSSTAIGLTRTEISAVWINLSGRGSAEISVRVNPAVP